MCVYCEGKQALYTWIYDYNGYQPGDIKTVADYIVIDDGAFYHGHFDNATGEDQETVEKMFDIIFCPVCGRQINYFGKNIEEEIEKSLLAEPELVDISPVVVTEN